MKSKEPGDMEIQTCHRKENKLTIYDVIFVSQKKNKKKTNNEILLHQRMVMKTMKN